MMRKYSSVLFALFIFVAGILMTGIVQAASSTEKVTHTDIHNKIKLVTSMSVSVQNLDLKAYEKYNFALKDADEDAVFAKAAPGSTVTISLSPAVKGKIEFSEITFEPMKIGQKDVIGIKGLKKRINREGTAVSHSYTIPKDVEMVIVSTQMAFDYTTLAGYKVPTDKIEGGFYSVERDYYIVTSEAAFKKVYKILTGKSLSGNISAPAKTETGKPKTGNPKQTVQPKEDEDEGGIGLVEIGGAAAVIGAGAWAASHFLGGGGAAGASGAADGASAEPETFIYTDPATGAQSLYEKDPDTGQWVNSQTGGVLDMSDLGRFTDQRGSDRKWMNTQMNNLGNRNTAFDTDLKNDWQNMLDKDAAIDQQGRKDKLALKTGTYGMTDQERNDFLTDRQNERINDMNKAHQTAKNWDTAVKTAEVVQTAADIGVDTLATVTAPVGGGVIADVYAVTKNVAGSTAEAVAEGKNVAGGFAKGLANGAVDVWQNHAGSKWNKAASLMGGETFKSGLDAGMKGESVVIGAAKGFGKGITKFGIDKAGEKIGKAIENSGKNSLTHAYNHARDIRTVYSKDISQKSVDTLKQMNIQKHLANMQKANHQSMANTITNATARNTLPNGIFGE